jgi:DnaK suppressor protein
MISSPATLDKSFLASQRDRLLAERARLSSAIDLGAEEDRLIQGADAGQANESEDLAQDLTISEYNRVLRGELAAQRLAIDRALAKIDEGTYGVSDDSSEHIPLARLQAYPQAVRTADEEALRSEFARAAAIRTP